MVFRKKVIILDREKALNYFNRTGYIYMAIHYISSEAVQAIVLRYDDFDKAVKNREYYENNGCKAIFCNLTTAKRCLYPYGDIVFRD